MTGPPYENLKFEIKSSDELTSDEIEQSFELSVKEYPAFREYYEENRYYSSIKPQLVSLVFDGPKLVADGKLLWRDLHIEGHGIVKFFGCGFLVLSERHGQGIGGKMLNLVITRARELRADLLFASTENPVMAHLLQRERFQKIAVPVDYEHAKTRDIIPMESHGVQCYVLDFQGALVDKINTQVRWNIGIGPV